MNWKERIKLLIVLVTVAVVFYAVIVFVVSMANTSGTRYYPERSLSINCDISGYVTGVVYDCDDENIIVFMKNIHGNNTSKFNDGNARFSKCYYPHFANTYMNKNITIFAYDDGIYDTYSMRWVEVLD